MTMNRRGVITRRSLLGAVPITAAAAVPGYAGIFRIGRGSRHVRRLRMYSERTGESLDSIYWADGQYIDGALSEVSFFMRDWRNGEVRNIDKRVLDIVAAVHAALDTEEPYTLVSGYRSPDTNRMLRRRSSGVAKSSRHLLGQAADLSLRSRSVDQVFQAASAVSTGGIGRYSSSGFVHMDCGPVRSWGR